MKNSNILLAACLFMFAFYSKAQQKVALQSGGVTTIYSSVNPFVAAYNAAVPGDTIYLPGGVFSTYPTLDKRLVIYGAGLHPDSTIATNSTVLSGNLTINGNADSLELHGLYITGDIIFGYNAQANHVTITRCLFSTLEVPGNLTTFCNNLLINESIILGNVTLTNATNSSVTNCLVGARVYNGYSNAFQNNIFFYEANTAYYTVNNTDNSLFANNVFLKSNASIHNSSELTTFSNNVFGSAVAAGTTTFTGNYMSTPLATFFVNQTGNTPDFNHDYHLTSPATFLGMDGSQVGIYGGVYPMKTGNVPVNPHIISKNIAPQTGTTGDLNIQIQVGAQDH